MRARLERLASDEIPDLAAWSPPVPGELAVALVLEMGALGHRGRERFEVLAATPAGWSGASWPEVARQVSRLARWEGAKGGACAGRRPGRPTRRPPGRSAARP